MKTMELFCIKDSYFDFFKGDGNYETKLIHKKGEKYDIISVVEDTVLMSCKGIKTSRYGFINQVSYSIHNDMSCENKIISDYFVTKNGERKLKLDKIQKSQTDFIK